MSLKGSKTKADFIEWGSAQSLILKLERDGNWKFALLIATGIFTGLRIGDVLTLKWNDILDQDILQIVEKKTKKSRNITINSQLKQIARRIYNVQKNINADDLIFLNRFGTDTISIQYINQHLKRIAVEYKITKDPNSIKSHSLRKSFGRRVFEVNDNSELALILLSDILNHTSAKTTKAYLGIRDKEIADVYANL